MIPIWRQREVELEKIKEEQDIDLDYCTFFHSDKKVNLDGYFTIDDLKIIISIMEKIK